MASQTEVHLWCKCHHCGMQPVAGACFRCETCPVGPDADLCLACYELYRSGQIRHPTPGSPHPAGLPSSHRFRRLPDDQPESLLPWLHTPCPKNAAPAVPHGFLVRLEFRSASYSAFAAYGFVAEHHGESFILTALHAMDELIKYKRIDTTDRNKRYSGTELPRVVSSVCAYDVLKDRWMLHPLGEGGPMLVLPNARTGDVEPISWRDVAALSVKASGALTPVGLAETEPQLGDPVWLAARMADETRTQRAVCVEVSPLTLVFRFDEVKSAPMHTSGAPILDQSGKVVGINTGRGRFEGREFGHGVPLSSIRAHLATARFPSDRKSNYAV
jgi:hypothetical protein